MFPPDTQCLKAPGPGSHHVRPPPHHLNLQGSRTLSFQGCVCSTLTFDHESSFQRSHLHDYCHEPQFVLHEDLQFACPLRP